MSVRMILDLDGANYYEEFSGPGKTCLGERPSLQVFCDFDSKTGRLRRKVERGGYDAEERLDSYEYSYDAKGHLLEVTRNRLPAEKYEYNDWGQRWCKQSGFYDEHKCDYYIYLKDDSLREAGRDEFEYDRRGNTVARVRDNERTAYSYRRGVLLERVDLPDGRVISYVYGKEVPPLARYLNGRLDAEYIWRPLKGGVFLLLASRDHTQGLQFDFGYEARHCPESVIVRKLSGNADKIWSKLPKDKYGNVVLRCGCDQVGSLKRLADANGDEVKYLDFDSFGNLLSETLPELRLPWASPPASGTGKAALCDSAAAIMIRVSAVSSARTLWAIPAGTTTPMITAWTTRWGVMTRMGWCRWLLRRRRSRAALWLAG